MGSEAPDFVLRDQHGEEIRLSSYRGRSNVVLVFYPYAFSGPCTGELGAIRDNPELFESGDAVVLGVSCDAMYSLRIFADTERLGFSLLSDFWPHGAVASSYGVFDADRGCSVRGTFVIDQAGLIRWSVVNPIPQPRDLNDYAEALAALGSGLG
ncbi:peroxiredoxin [Kribbella deserti]|uniref:thioredoxin-dependent peroxiredoxin n=1 Tax=Kribbella deserti TaxID=1926257 RepID=A0ABV6QE65_9ACTN